MDLARRFIAGTNTDEVVEAAQRERKLNRGFTLDILGEAVKFPAGPGQIPAEAGKIPAELGKVAPKPGNFPQDLAQFPAKPR